ncbi:NlpC/P60 family protein [Actinoplanes sp. NPDC051343]|uniref:NlpC/P60 family protein n=1 Tax=Actinoplanes sp. NPDC051343 TaxID=3363906 RepID=UPI00378DF0BB
MTGRLLALITGSVVAVLLCVAAIAGIGGTAASTCLPAPAASGGPISGYDADQLRNAAVIVQVGTSRHLPIRAAIIAVATGIQESGLHNSTATSDHDSLGLFQQRPGQGWGTPQQLRDPIYASGKFYDKLLSVANWQTLPLTVVAQAVQRSAYPDAYAKYEADAATLVAYVGSGNPSAIPDGLELCTSICPSDAVSPNRVPGPACADVTAVFARARSWLHAWRGGGPVPYLRSNVATDLFGGYRRDCSGYVSMALGLRGPGLNTIELAARSRPISKADLQPGGLMINPAPRGAGHVVLFERWGDASKSSYYGFEQSGDGGTHYREIPYPYFGSYTMSPYEL